MNLQNKKTFLQEVIRKIAHFIRQIDHLEGFSGLNTCKNLQILSIFITHLIDRCKQYILNSYKISNKLFLYKQLSGTGDYFYINHF